MQQRRRKLIGIGLVMAMVPAASGALADDEGKRRRRDHEVAREALTSGEIRPLEAIIAEVHRSVPGDIVSIELEKYSGNWVYKIKVIAPTGVMQRMTVDARSSAAPAPAAAQTAPLEPGGPMRAGVYRPAAAGARSR